MWTLVPTLLHQGGDLAEQEALVMGVVALGFLGDQDRNRGRQVPGQLPALNNQIIPPSPT